MENGGSSAEARPGEEATSTKGKIFFSYTRQELEPARQVMGLLERAGYDVWWDGLLTGGDTFLPTTEAALEGADCVVVLWSETAVNSHWVRDEAQRGRERGCLVPLSLDGTMSPLGFRQVQLVDIQDWDGKYDSQVAQRILAAVASQMDQSAPNPITVPTEQAPGVSRRGLIMSGAAIAGLTAVGLWQFMPSGSVDGESVSMAVLPFSNLTGDDEKSWFSNGLSNELRAALMRNPRLLVSAPTSSTLREGEDDFAVARALGVGNVLRGSVQLVAETVRISAELVQVSDGLVRWAESFDREFANVFEVQTEIAEAVALSLVAEIASEGEAQQSVAEQAEVGGTSNITAYEAYLRGWSFYDLSSGIESDQAALAQFDAAIAADPQYAAAHAMRSTMLAAAANYASGADEVNRLYDRSIEAAEQAIAIEPRLARGHLALGFALNNGKLDRQAAYPHYQSAQQLSPGDPDTQRSVAIFYAYGDQQALATQMIDRVLELDPLNARAFRTAGYIALFARDYTALISRMQSALELNPNLASAHFAIGNAQYMRQDYTGALASFEAEPVQIFGLTGAAICHDKLNNRAAASAALSDMVSQSGDAGFYQQAQVHAQWGNTDTALELLDRALAKSDPGLLFAPNDPLLDPLRGEPGLTRLLSRLSS